MKIIVDKVPKISEDCIFSWRDMEYSYSKRRCRFGGICKMENNIECNHLLTINQYKEGNVE